MKSSSSCSSGCSSPAAAASRLVIATPASPPPRRHHTIQPTHPSTFILHSFESFQPAKTSPLLPLCTHPRHIPWPLALRLQPAPSRSISSSSSTPPLAPSPSSRHNFSPSRRSPTAPSRPRSLTTSTPLLCLRLCPPVSPPQPPQLPVHYPSSLPSLASPPPPSLPTRCSFLFQTKSVSAIPRAKRRKSVAAALQLHAQHPRLCHRASSTVPPFNLLPRRYKVAGFLFAI